MTIDPTADGRQAAQDLEAQAASMDPADVAVLNRASAELAVSTDRDPSPGLLPAVMETVWAELRPGQLIPLPGSDGTLLVTETAVGNALVAHLDGLPELLVRRCAVRYQVPSDADGADGAGAGESGGGGADGDGADFGGTGSPDGTLQIALTAAVAYGTATDDLIRRSRSVLALGAEQLFGLRVWRVDVEIVDVFPAPGTQR